MAVFAVGGGLLEREEELLDEGVYRVCELEGVDDEGVQFESDEEEVTQ